MIAPRSPHPGRDFRIPLDMVPLFIGLVILCPPGINAARGGDGDREGRGTEEVAALVDVTGAHVRPHAGGDAEPSSTPELDDPITRARRLMKGCGERYESVHDYTCLFYKRERVDGRLTTQAVMSMKARTRPMSVYLRFFRPNAGREAIWVWGQNQGRVVVHDVGVYKFLAGTMHLDPLGSRAMEDNRHPITDAGIGRLIETVNGRWDHELKPGESIVTIHPDQRLGDRPSLLIVTVHPERRPEFLFHQVKIYIDREHNLPVRFEGYDWPTRPGAAPELVEEYIYANLKLNVGLTERDFDPHNEQYSFGRF